MVERDWTEHEDYPFRVRREVVDPMLSTVAILPETSAVTSLGIVLATPGGLIHGQLISQAAWYDEWFKVLASGGSLNTAIADSLKKYLTASGRLNDEGALVDHVGAYLHLRDAVFYYSNNFVNKMLWRVDITSVYAWSLGAAAPERTEDRA